MTSADERYGTSGGAEERGRRARLIAFYLPQFHPILENNRWWGEGYTEWRLVAQALPLFRGHYQPHVPADLGFYDLRVPETRAAQAALAAQYGVEAFCYYHYWFHGHRLLGQPFDEVLHSGDPRFPFCLAWANHNWTRGFFGDGERLQEQTYSDADDIAHARWLVSAFADDRYVRVGGRPLFLIYRGRDLPDPRRTTDTFREECTRAGLPEPLLVGVNAFTPWEDSRTFGFDATLDFEPQLGDLPDHLVNTFRLSKLRRNRSFGVWSGTLDIHDYREARAMMGRRRAALGFSYYPSILVRWDNTPRRGRRAIVMVNDDPRHFGRALDEAVSSVAALPLEERLVFLNAWNEWGEGNHLEADVRHGLSYLEEVGRVALSPGAHD